MRQQQIASFESKLRGDVVGAVAIVAIAAAILVCFHLLLDGNGPLSLLLRSIYTSGRSSGKPGAVLFVSYGPAFIAGVGFGYWRPLKRHTHRSTLAVAVVVCTALFLLNLLYPRLVSFDLWWLKNRSVGQWVGAFFFNVSTMCFPFWLAAKIIEEHRLEQHGMLR